MNSKTNSPVLNPMARQNVYISPRLQPINIKLYADPLYECTISSDTTSDMSSDASSDTNLHPFFASNDSLSSFEDYRIDIEKKENDRTRLSNCNRGIMSSICCSWCSRS
jgi:hypothetical protein